MKPKKSHPTRELIVSCALKQSADIGLEGISLGGIATAVGMSKSGLFAHFKSKETLQLAVVDAAADLFQEVVLAPAGQAPEGLSRLRTLYIRYLDWMAGSSGLSTCPFTVFVQEYDGRPGPIRDRLVEFEFQWRSTVANIAKGAVRLGQLPPHIDPAQLAFELVGLAFSFQVSHSLLQAKDAQKQAVAGFERLCCQPC